MKPEKDVTRLWANLRQEITLFSGIGQMSTTLLGTGLFMVPAIAAGIAGPIHYGHG